MTKQEKARQLREKGLTYSQIAKACEATAPTVFRWLNPDYAERQRAVSRAWKKGNRLACERCGGPRSPDHRSRLCAACGVDAARKTRRGQTRKRTEEMLRLRCRGLLNYEIAERLGTTQAAVATALQRSRVARYDLNHEPSPYHTRRTDFAEAA